MSIQIRLKGAPPSKAKVWSAQLTVAYNRYLLEKQKLAQSQFRLKREADQRRLNQMFINTLKTPE